jgi:hypothetical protein
MGGTGLLQQRSMAPINRETPLEQLPIAGNMPEPQVNVLIKHAKE